MAMVIISTVDRYMGEENSVVILDTCSYVGFLFDLRRTIVACTRAKDGFVIIGDSLALTKVTPKLSTMPGAISKRNHPFRRAIELLYTSKRAFVSS